MEYLKEGSSLATRAGETVEVSAAQTLKAAGRAHRERYGKGGEDEGSPARGAPRASSAEARRRDGAVVHDRSHNHRGSSLSTFVQKSIWSNSEIQICVRLCRLFPPRSSLFARCAPLCLLPKHQRLSALLSATAPPGLFAWGVPGVFPTKTPKRRIATDEKYGARISPLCIVGQSRGQSAGAALKTHHAQRASRPFVARACCQDENFPKLRPPFQNPLEMLQAHGASSAVLQVTVAGTGVGFTETSAGLERHVHVRAGGQSVLLAQGDLSERELQTPSWNSLLVLHRKPHPCGVVSCPDAQGC